MVDRTLGGGAKDRVSRQNRAAEFGAFADFPFLQVAEELVFKVVSQSVVEQNIVQSIKEQFLVVPMPLLKEQLVEVMLSVSQVKIQLVEQIIVYLCVSRQFLHRVVEQFQFFQLCLREGRCSFK